MSILGQTRNIMKSARGANSGESAAIKEPYDINTTNWYKSLPYGFKFSNKNATSESDTNNSTVMYLPILPSNIQVVTHFATNIVVGLYGVTEEHSEVRFYDITITGTTGIAPKWVGEQGPKDKVEEVTSTGRSAFDGTRIAADITGFFENTRNILTSAIGNAQGLEGITGRPPNITGVAPNKTGYAAFHNLYRFFLKYKQDAAGITSNAVSERKIHPIQFLNYKDGIKFDVVPQNFTLTRSEDNPMLYNYNIRLKAYNLRNIGEEVDGIDQLEKLGLGGMQGQSLFNGLSRALGRATTIVSSVL